MSEDVLFLSLEKYFLSIYEVKQVWANSAVSLCVCLLCFIQTRKITCFMYLDICDFIGKTDRKTPKFQKNRLKRRPQRTVAKQTKSDFNHGQKPIRTRRTNEACSWLCAAVVFPQITLHLLNSQLIPVRGCRKFPGNNNDDKSSVFYRLFWFCSRGHVQVWTLRRNYAQNVAHEITIITFIIITDARDII